MLVQNGFVLLLRSLASLTQLVLETGETLDSPRWEDDDLGHPESLHQKYAGFIASYKKLLNRLHEHLDNDEAITLSAEADNIQAQIRSTLESYRVQLIQDRTLAGCVLRWR